MKTVDWTSMTPLEVWHAVRTAPKVAGPWRQEEGAPALWYRDLSNDTLPVRAAIGDIRSDIDRQLREAGYLLVDE